MFPTAGEGTITISETQLINALTQNQGQNGTAEF